MAYTTRDIQRTELWEVASKLVSFDTVSAHSNMEAVEFIANYDKRRITCTRATR